ILLVKAFHTVAQIAKEGEAIEPVNRLFDVFDWIASKGFHAGFTRLIFGFGAGHEFLIFFFADFILGPQHAQDLLGHTLFDLSKYWRRPPQPRGDTSYAQKNSYFSPRLHVHNSPSSLYCCLVL